MNTLTQGGQRMRLKVIACEVLFREVCLCAAYSRNIISVDFLQQGLHNNPDLLRTEVQKRIDQTDENAYNGILLVYALCSNGTVGICSRGIPLIIPKAHDCITLFLGSKEKYKQHFDENPGTYYYTSGWLEHSGNPVEMRAQVKLILERKYEEYVKKYGEDNAKYLMEFESSWVNNYSRVAFIDFDFVKFLNYNEKAKEIAVQRNWEYDEITGDMQLIRKLIDGEWDDGEFLVVQPGEEISASYDDQILECRQLNQNPKLTV